MADLVTTRLEEVGAAIGRRLAERLTRDRGRFASDLETVRFLCKEFWTELNGKSADGLRTDKKGTFQVDEKSFRFLARISAAPDVNVKDEALRYVALPCGIVRGALELLGFEGTQVKCQIVALPAAKFVITIPANKSV